MKECKDIDPVRTDRVSVWINKVIKFGGTKYGNY